MKHKWDKGNLRELYFEQGKTLQEIGELYGVTKERVCQVMDSYSMPRIRSRATTFGHREYRPRYASLEDYIGGTYEARTDMIRKYLDIDTIRCSECGSSRNIHLHHITYPAKSIEDIQPLCAVCHKLKHIKGMTLIRQMDLFYDYKKGLSYTTLATQYNISKASVNAILRKIRNGWHTTRG